MNAKNPTDPHAQPAAPRPANDEGCCHGAESELRAAGARLLDETKNLMDETRSLRAELAKQAQQHPLATFGIAFAAGLLVARALRR